MLNSDLLNLFNSLTIKELKGFSVYLFNLPLDQGRYRAEGRELFKLLQQYAISKKESLLEKDKVAALIFAEKGGNVAQIERVMFELSQLIRVYLLSERYFSKENEARQQLDFVRILQEKKMHAKARNVLNQTLNEIKRVSTKGADQYFIAFDASAMVYSLASENTSLKDDLNISETLHFLDLHYWSQKLHLVNHYLFLNIFSKVGIPENIMPKEIPAELYQITVEEDPSIFISFKIYQLLTDQLPQVDKFEQLRLLLQTNETRMDVETIKLYHSYLRNYCTYLYLHGHFELIYELHLIQKDNLDKGYFFYQGKIQSNSYSSITNTALLAENYEWALQFINDYKDQMLDAENSEETYRLNLACYYFYTNQLDHSIKILPPSSNNLDRHLTARRLEIKIYYELDSELLIYKVEAFKVYIHRASKKIISSATYERNANFANLLYQVIQTPKSDKAKLTKILQRINSKQQVAEKEWLLEKMQLLTQGRGVKA